MWITILFQALGFALTHIPELIAAIQALLAFFKAHRNNPQMSAWMVEFSQVLTTCKETRDARPLQAFLERIRDAVKGET